MGIIRSILDNDLYKFTMQQTVLEHYADVPVVYQFTNRNPDVIFSKDIVDELRCEIYMMKDLTLNPEELQFIRLSCPFLKPSYIEYLRNYRYDGRDVELDVVDGKLSILVKGTWSNTILWEVPLLAMVSELYFRKNPVDMEQQRQLALDKGNALNKMGVLFAEFGTRRRRGYEFQDIFVKSNAHNPAMVGASNVHMAQKYRTKPIGTMAHEWIMGVSALEGLRNANRHALQKWVETYRGSLGTALTDTFGTDAFFNDFDSYFAKLFDGVRHDSGDPIVFAKKVIAHYQKLGIDPTLKTIVFSDGLNIEEVKRIEAALGNRIRRSYGIGTFFTNDVKGSKALNIVMKLKECNGIPVVKLSDSPTKAIGDKDALRVAKWTFFKTPLDD